MKNSAGITTRTRLQKAIAMAAVLGSSAAVLIAAPALAAAGLVTAEVFTSCDDGGTLTVSMTNGSDIDQRVSLEVDDGNDGEGNYGDHVNLRPGESFDYPLIYGASGVHRVSVTTEDDGLIADEVVAIDCPTYYVTRYDGTVWQVDDDAIRPLSYVEWQAAGFPNPKPAPTDYVRYAWSSTISAVTFFGQARDRWVWHHVSLDEWGRAGYPSPRNAGWIQGSVFYQWGTSDQIFVQDVGGVRHALTYAEWQDSGFEPFERRASQGFVKLTWDNSIAFLTNVQAGQGGPIGYDRWSSEGFPRPATAARFAGDQVWRNYGSPEIWYSGPTVNRPINGSEWAAMGNPAPEVRGTPPRPTKDKDCGDYGSQRLAQADFDYLYPAHGDVYRLDANNNGVACEDYRY